MNNDTFTISKSTMETYKIRTKDGFAWADINIDPSKNGGRIQIASDYGEWQNYWGSCGTSFKEFLTRLNLDYFAGKVGADRYFDYQATIQSLKEQIKGYSLAEDNKELKTELHNELKVLRNAITKDYFIQVIQDCSNIMNMTNHMPDLINGIDPGFKRFFNEIWPVFINELKNELATSNPS